MVAPPQAKRPRKSMGMLLRAQQHRQDLPRPDAADVDAIVQPDSSEVQAPVQFAEPISVQIDASDTAADSAGVFEGAALSRKRQLGRAGEFAAAQERQVNEDVAVLRSSEDMGNDLSVKTSLHLSTAHLSFRWLRRLPPALFCQSLKGEGAKASAARDSVLEVCRECLPALTEAPDKAVRWMERIASCLSWHQLDGPLRPPHRPVATRSQAPGAEERTARRRVEEWDEAYRGLEVMLRQGVVPTFTVLTDRFSVSVFGEGSGPWVASQTGANRMPSSSRPCAVMCPAPAHSLDNLRTMLQESHVPFEVAVLSKASACGLRDPSAMPAAGKTAGSSACDGAMVAQSTASGEPKRGTMEQDSKSDLRELRRDGERVLCPEDMHGTAPMCEALWFDGPWRVHSLLDVLRQHFLGAPLPSGPQPPHKLPRLVSPAPFCHATTNAVEVVKTQTLTRQGGGSLYTAELSGYFFPRQLRMLLEMFRVLLPSFACGLTAEVSHRAGINAFTQLGMQRIESVECERTQAGQDAAAGWRWEFKLGA